MTRSRIMHLVVSFCNLRAPGGPALGLLDLDPFALQVLELPPEVARCAGFTGLALSADHLFAVVQSNTPGIQGSSESSLLIFDRNNLALLNHYVFRSASDVHSVAVQGNAIYAVSTGTDEVLELRLRGVQIVSETCRWRPDAAGPRQDLHHLNSIYLWKDDLLVSGFGKKGSGTWDSARNGFIASLLTGEMLATGLDQPHSLADVGGRLTYCESRAKRVGVVGEQRIQHLPGYTRGLCAVGGRLFVGTSVGRQFSKSSGLINNPATGGVPGGQCTISRLSEETLEIEQTIDLSVHAQEIYDLLPVEGVSGWPVVAELSWRNNAIQELSALLDQRTTWAKQASASLAQRENTVNELQARLADIAELRSAMRLQSEQIHELRNSFHQLQERLLQAQEDALSELRSFHGTHGDSENSEAPGYRTLLRHVRETVDAHVPGDATIAVVSRGDDELLKLRGRRGWHFPQTNEGTYAGGNPINSLSAIAQLTALQVQGADFLLFPNTAFWWLEYYDAFRQHLEQRYLVLTRNADCVIYDLRHAIASPTLRPTTLSDILDQCEHRLGCKPAILDWNSGLQLASILPQCTIFSPPTSSSDLPYLDRSVDVVVTLPNPSALSEARRVARGAIVTTCAPTNGHPAGRELHVEWQDRNGTDGSATTVSIILVSGSEMAQRQLAALRASLPPEFDGEILEAAGDASFADNGYAPRCNLAASRAKGEVLVFLDGCTIPLDGWLPPLLELIHTQPSVAAVGGKLLSAQGFLAQAGGVVFNDGAMTGFGDGDYQIDDPLYAYVREVDYSADGMLAITRSLFAELGGFEPAWRSPALTHADCCFRARDRGLRTFYQPETCFVLIADSGCVAAADDERPLFAERWSHVLRTRPLAPHWRDRDTWHSLTLSTASTTQQEVAR